MKRILSGVGIVLAVLVVVVAAAVASAFIGPQWISDGAEAIPSTVTTPARGATSAVSFPATQWSRLGKTHDPGQLGASA